MKFAYTLVVMILISGPAHAFELYGHWQSTEVATISNEQFKVHNFEFNVSDPKIAHFILCSCRSYPNTEIFLEGTDDPQTGKSVVTTAYLCTGEINLSTCQKADKKWFCH